MEGINFAAVAANKPFSMLPELLSFFFKQFCLTILFFIQLNTVSSQPVITYNPVITGLTSPVDIVNAGDASNRIFIVEQNGTIKVFNSSYASLGTFLTVTGIATGGEQGLLSMAFHPNYEVNGFFWVYYTNSAGDLEVSRFKVSSGNANQADASSRQVVLIIQHPGQTNHNGAKLNFGNDGFLYFATGDGGGGGDQNNNAQNGNSLLGKMIRINVSTGTTPPFYSVPADNPFVSNPNVLDEIWALGLRNPFRWSFDRNTNDMWIGDVGQDAREEINYRAAGSTGGINYGWRCYEGSLPYNTTGCLTSSNYVFPVYDYANPNPGSASVTGGLVYRGSTHASMQGYYFAADVYSGTLYKINTAGFTTTVQTGLATFVVGFGETENGELLNVSLNGTAYAVIPNTPTSVRDMNAEEKKPFIYPTVIHGNRLTIHLPSAYHQLQIINSHGAIVQQQSIAGQTGTTQITLTTIAAGVYIVRLIGKEKFFAGKIIVHN